MVASITSFEEIDGQNYVVFAFLPVWEGLAKDSVRFGFESTSDLVNGPWSELTDGVDGVIIEISSSGSVLKMPFTNEVFCRMVVDTGD